jgi:hypothetical protein
VGLGLVWPPLGELCAPILPIVEPADGGDELCSLAPPEVSALPDGGTVADLDASGDVVLAVGGFMGVSAAKTGAIPRNSANAVNAIRRVAFLKARLGYERALSGIDHFMPVLRVAVHSARTQY